MTDLESRKTYFNGRLSRRRPASIIICVAAIVCAGVLITTLLRARAIESFENVIVMGFVGLLACAFAIFGAYMVKWIVVGGSDVQVIDSRGISARVGFYQLRAEWAQVHSLVRHQKRLSRRYDLHIVVDTWFPNWSTVISIDDGLSTEECDALMEALEKEIGSRFEDIEFG
jgi:hypothetical protein